MHAPGLESQAGGSTGLGLPCPTHCPRGSPLPGRVPWALGTSILQIRGQVATPTLAPQGCARFPSAETASCRRCHSRLAGATLLLRSPGREGCRAAGPPFEIILPLTPSHSGPVLAGQPRELQNALGSIFHCRGRGSRLLMRWLTSLPSWRKTNRPPTSLESWPHPPSSFLDKLSHSFPCL